MGNVAERPVLPLFAGHGDEVSLVPADDLQVPYDETVLEGYGCISLQFVLVHREYLDVSDLHPAHLPFPVDRVEARSLTKRWALRRTLRTLLLRGSSWRHPGPRAYLQKDRKQPNRSLTSALHRLPEGRVPRCIYRSRDALF